MAIDLTKTLSPEQQAAIAAGAAEILNPQPEAAAPIASSPAEVLPPAPAVPAPNIRQTVREVNEQAARDDAAFQRSLQAPVAPLRTAVRTPPYAGTMSKASIWGGLADEYQKQADYNWQKMLTAQRESLVKERTDAKKMAMLSSLGNAMRMMVQPLGWAAGGKGAPTGTAIAPVQSYDNRAYIDAFNRAIKANQDLRSLDSGEERYALQTAGQKADHARRMAQIYARYETKDKGAETPEQLFTKRQEAAYTAWLKERYNWHEGARRVPENFFTYMEQNGGEKWFGPKANWLADDPNVARTAVSGATTVSASGTKATAAKKDPRDLNGDGEVTRRERRQYEKMQKAAEKQKEQGSKKAEEKATPKATVKATSKPSQTAKTSATTQSASAKAAEKWGGIAKK